MSRRIVPLGDKGANPRMQRHDVRLTSGAWRTSAVGKLTRHFKKSAKMSKNERNEPKLEKVNKSLLSGNEKVNKSQPPRKSSKY